jgi:putative FmdB family regulatory protein
MPLYDLTCDYCGYEIEKLMGMKEPMPLCPTCKNGMRIQYSAPPMVKYKGEGGYPSRKRQVFNTTSRNHPPLEKKKHTKIY